MAVIFGAFLAIGLLAALVLPLLPFLALLSSAMMVVAAAAAINGMPFREILTMAVGAFALGQVAYAGGLGARAMFCYRRGF